MVTFLTILFIIICLMLIFMVVITPSSDSGMASAFGGMGGDSFFGTKAQSHISRFTVFLAVSFMLLALAINWVNAHPSQPDEGLDPETPATEPAPDNGN